MSNKVNNRFYCCLYVIEFCYHRANFSRNTSQPPKYEDKNKTVGGDVNICSVMLGPYFAVNLQNNMKVFQMWCGHHCCFGLSASSVGINASDGIAPSFF